MAQPLVPLTTLPAGATSFLIKGLSAGQQYTAVVTHQEPAPSTGYTQPSQVTFTTSATVGACAAPDDPIAFVVPYPVGGNMTSGFACYNNELVDGTNIFIQMAVETAPSSGTFGPWLNVDSIATPPASWCIKIINLPNDGCHRQFQAQAIRQGTTASAFTPPVALLPGTIQAPADFPVAVPSGLTIAPVDVVLPTGMTVALVATYTPPTDHDFSHMEYSVQPWTGSAWGTAQLVVGSNQGSDTILAQGTTGGLYQITPVAVSTGEATVQVVPGSPILATRNTLTPWVGTVPGISNAPNITVASAGASSIIYNVPFDVGTAFIIVYSTNPSSNPGSIDSVESPANYVAPNLVPPKGGGAVQLALSVTSGNPWRATTFVPYSNASVRGTAVTLVTQRNTAVTQPSAPTLSLATFGGTGGTNGGTGPSGGSWNFPGWVGIKATFVTAPSAGDQITLYRSGAQCSPVYTITSGDVGAGFATVIDQTFTASGTQSYTATQTGTVSGGGTSAMGAGFNVTLGSAYKLSGPTVSLTGGNAYRAPMFVTATMPSDNEAPPELGITVQYAYTSGGPPGSWTTLTTLGVSGTSYQIAPQPLNFTYVQVFATCAGGYSNSNAATANKQNPGFI